MDTDDKDKASDQLSLNIQYKTIRCRILPGILHNENKGAVDWGWQSMIAYGCHTIVVVVDPKSVQVLQTLNKHHHMVVKIKWAKENYYHDLSNPYYPKLASADSSGTIIVWDVIYSKSISSFSDGHNKPVLDMEWLSFWNNCNDFLAVLHQSYSFVIWNTTNGNKLWKKTYTESLLCFSFDPFEPSNVAFLAQDSILFIDDFTLNKTPSSNGRKFYISNPSSVNAVNSNLGLASGGLGTADEKLWTTEKFRRRVQFLVKADTKLGNKHDDSTGSTSCLGLMYHRTCRHQLLLLYPKEILIIDLEINQTIGIISMERNGSPFTQIYPCQQEDAFFILHENGSISVRIRKKNYFSVNNSDGFFNTGNISTEIHDDSNMESDLDMNYEIICQSDSLRLTKTSQLMGMACCPISEKKVIIILTDGRLLLLHLIMTNKNIPSDYGINIVSDYYSKGNTPYCKTESIPSPRICLSDLLHYKSSKGCLQSTEKCDSSSSFKFLLSGLLVGIAPPPVVIRMCPPLTTRNWISYNPWLAIGTFQGIVQIVCMASGIIQKELSIHSCPVRGIEWISLHAFLTFAYPAPGNSSGIVRNELILTDIITGKQRILRPERNEESAIEMVRVSCHKQYFIIAFKDDPFELWDLQRLILLRTMPKKFPVVTALEWSPMCSIKKKIGSIEKESMDKLCDNTEGSFIFTEKSSQQLDDKILAKENFVFTDPDGQLYNFSVEGNIIKDGFKIPSDGSIGSITCIAWRLDQIVMGDVDGNLTQWELKTNSSVIIPTHRGWIKKIRFAPGRGNMKILILYNNGVEIWDFREMEKVSSIKSPSDLPKIYDIDWAASDTPVLACVDGCIYLMDLKLKHCTSPTYRYHLNEPVYLPYLSTTEAALNLKTFLQHQNWRPNYSLEFSEKDGIREEDVTALQNYITSIDNDIREYLPHCPFGTSQRCFLTARLFGDESELHFWITALHYLRANRHEDQKTADSTELLSTFEDNRQVEKIITTQFLEPLDSSYDILCDLSTFRKRELERLVLHDSKRATYDQTKKCAESLIMLGQTDRAVQILLETDADNEHYYTDNLRACLVSSVCSSGAAQSTIKLVGTNLIANGCISEGVQLLCLINKSADACRYLQSYGHWNKAAWLAKATLNYSDCLDVMKRWVDHLISTQINQKQKAVLVLLSMFQFQKVIELLMSMKAVERAAMFIHSCEEFGILKKYKINSLIEAVFLEYARYLFCLGNTPAAYYYCNLVGIRGEQLRKEMEILAEDSKK